jgi:hypothetical protein
MDDTGRLLSLPRVNGTMQYEHMLLHPLMIELIMNEGKHSLHSTVCNVKGYTKAETPLEVVLTGVMSA